MTGIQAFGLALAVPFILLGGNWTVRQVAGLPRSAPADLLLLLVIFQLGIALEPHTFDQFFRNDAIRDGAPTIFILLMLVTIFVWMWLLFKAELPVYLYETHRKEKDFVEEECGVSLCRVKSRYAGKPTRPLRAYFLAMFLPGLSIGGTLGPFLLGA